jgi:hypothetical protein
MPAYEQTHKSRQPNQRNLSMTTVLFGFLIILLLFGWVWSE